MVKFDKFKARYDKAIENIESFLKPDSGLAGFTQWLLSTDINPYTFLPEGWAGHVGTAESLSSFLSIIHHALFDDGDITFCTVDGRPRLVFVDRHEPDFRNYALSKHELSLEKQFGSQADVKIINIDINDFGKLVDASETAAIRKYFVNDAARQGIDFAVNHYRRYALFSESWVTECADEIKSKAEIINKWAAHYDKNGTT